MNVKGVAVIFFLLMEFFLGLCKEGDGCRRFELLTCGDGYRRWQFCRPNTIGMVIQSVHLDLRYPNRYCRKKRPGLNFGLTESRSRMWVFDYCFGTFMVCLNTDTSVAATIKSALTSSNPVNSTSPSTITGTVQLDTTTVFPTTTRLAKLFKTSSDDIKNRGIPDTQEASVNKSELLTDDNQTVQNAPDSSERTNNTALPRAPLVGHLSFGAPGHTTTGSIALDQDRVSWGASVVNEDGSTVTPQGQTALLDPALKTLIMSAIITGGTVLIFLVILATIIVLKCNRTEPQTEYGTTKTIGRREKCSTSELLESEVENSVYDVIPCDVISGTPKPRASGTRNTQSVYDRHSELTERAAEDTTCHGLAANDGGANDTEIKENPYDHIVSSFKPVVLYNGTYSKVCVDRTAPSKTCDSCVQTERESADVADEHKEFRETECTNKVIKHVKDSAHIRTHNTL